MTKRKFYKHIITVEVISENDAVPNSLEDVAYQMLTGEDSGVWEVTSTKTLNGKQAAKALIAQGSDPEFFGIDEDGNDI